VAAGGTPFALAAMDGGPGYWHPHATDDPLGSLLDEFLPLLKQRKLDTDRVAALGWSMGGYGALLCGLTAPERILAVAAAAPAFWPSYAEAEQVNPGAFDSAEEWVRYDVLARAGELDRLNLRIDCGESDSFAPVVRTLRSRLADPSVVHFAKGCHDPRFWHHIAPAQLAMIGTAFAAT
jgi:S-formylglutathione hydrolase FrmB